MTKIISEMLGANEPLFSIQLEQLERATMRPNIDIRLTSAIIASIHKKTRELGLDPTDTTDQELYQALHNLTRLHDVFLARRIGGEDPYNVAEMLPLIQVAVEKLNVPRTAWLLKHSVAKKLVKATPPKKLMKILGYRSVDSMLKRETIGALYAGMRFAESTAWFSIFMTQYEKLRPSDFETRDVEVLRLDNKRWHNLAEQYVRAKHHNVMQIKELGVVALLPLPVERLPGITITVLPLLLHAINEIRLYSAYFKLQQVQPNFGKNLASSLLDNSGHHVYLAGHAIHWRVVQRHFGSATKSHLPEIFQPHLQTEDLLWRRVEQTLYHLEPALHFWHNLDFVSVVGHDHNPISFNIMDSALNYINQLPYSHRVYGHSQASLWNELYGRYLLLPSVEQQILNQFDTAIFEVESLPLSFGKRSG
ncbi:MAG: hypothetical protein NVS1B7_4050 [Candidatus Saccharimonadales bacterium]